jgi:hypothetical protein
VVARVVAQAPVVTLVAQVPVVRLVAQVLAVVASVRALKPTLVPPHQLMLTVGPSQVCSLRGVLGAMIMFLKLLCWGGGMRLPLASCLLFLLPGDCSP